MPLLGSRIEKVFHNCNILILFLCCGCGYGCYSTHFCYFVFNTVGGGTVHSCSDQFLVYLQPFYLSIYSSTQVIVPFFTSHQTNIVTTLLINCTDLIIDT